MIHWAWIPVSLAAGVIAGFWLAALLETGRRADESSRKWWEDELRK